MKRIYIALALLVLIAAACIATLTLEKRQLQTMIAMTHTMEDACRKEDYAKALDTANTLKEEFGKRTKTFAMFLRHNELKEIEETVLLLPMYLELDEVNHFYIDVARCRLLLQKQLEIDLPILPNIF